MVRLSRRLFIPSYYFTEEWRKLRKAVCKRDKNVCQYCRGYGVQADHVIPRGKGGSDTLRNLVCCCPRCNKLCRGRLFKSFTHKRKWVQLKLRWSPNRAKRVRSDR